MYWLMTISNEVAALRKVQPTHSGWGRLCGSEHGRGIALASSLTMRSAPCPQMPYRCRSVDIIWSEGGQRCVALPIEVIEAAQYRGHLVLLNQELLDQVAIGPMQLNLIKSSFQGQLGGTHVLLHHRRRSAMACGVL
jgi:hypothetical protein